MPRSEFLAWMEFYKAQPFDDQARYHRPAVLVASSGVQEFDGPAAFRWLRREPDPVVSGFSEADMRTFKALGVDLTKRGK